MGCRWSDHVVPSHHLLKPGRSGSSYHPAGGPAIQFFFPISANKLHHCGIPRGRQRERISGAHWDPETGQLLTVPSPSFQWGRGRFIVTPLVSLAYLGCRQFSWDFVMCVPISLAMREIIGFPGDVGNVVRSC